MVPEPPTPVIADGTRVLVYELHVTNFGLRPLILRSIEVFAKSGASDRLLCSLRDSALSTAFTTAGRMEGGTRRIDPAGRAVVFMWLPLATTERTPSFLRHRLTFDPPDSAVPAPMIDSLITPVRRDRVVVLAPPVSDGDWLAGDGPSNSSAHRRSLIPLNGKARISQRFAIDLVKIGPNGNTWHDDRSRAENFWGFGEPVRAVAAGDVVVAVDSIANNVPNQPLPPMTIANIAGNHVIVRIGPAIFFMVAHLARGSVRVKPGQHVRRGEMLGQLGNSGQTTGPHLHLQVMDAPSPLAAEGIPFAFDQFTFLGFGREYEPDKHAEVPKRREITVEDAVIHFPARVRP